MAANVVEYGEPMVPPGKEWVVIDSGTAATTNV